MGLGIIDVLVFVLFVAARLPGGIAINIVTASWIIGIIAAAYVAFGEYYKQRDKPAGRLVQN